MRVNNLLRTIGKFAFGLLLALTVSADEPTTTASRLPLPHPPPAKAVVSATQPCVEPVAMIRRFHSQYLKHQRDDTMHGGIRSSKYSLVECINCHVTPNSEGKYPGINTTDHFCRSCHSYVAVTLDCFECHTSQPDTTSSEVGQLQLDSLKQGFLGTASAIR